MDGPVNAHLPALIGTCPDHGDQLLVWDEECLMWHCPVQGVYPGIGRRSHCPHVVTQEKMDGCPDGDFEMEVLWNVTTMPPASA